MKTTYGAAVTKARADLIYLDRLRTENVSAKTADIRERDLVRATFDE